jgi:inner membrane protease subunit 2
MALGSAWARAGSDQRFLRQFSWHLWRWATWIPPIIWFKEYVGEFTVINGPSMYPFLNENYNESLRRNVCWVQKLYAQDNLQRGMVVTFK